MCFDQMREKLGAGGSVSKVALHSKELGLSSIFSVSQFYLSPFHVLQLNLVCLISMHVSNNPRIFEVNEGIVDKDSASRQGVEEPKVSVFDSGTIEVRRGKGSSMKRCGILATTFAVDADKVGIFIDAPVRNVPSGLRLPFLIKEDDGVEMGLSAVVPYPPLTRMVGILKVTSERRRDMDRFGRGSGSGDGRLVLGEADGLVAVDAVINHVWLGEVKNTGYKK